MKTIDVRDLACPGPVLKLKDLLDGGEREVEMHVADELCRSNVTRFAASRNAEVSVEDPGDGTFVVTITAADNSASGRPGEEALLVSEAPQTETGERLVVQISAATMGSGHR